MGREGTRPGDPEAEAAVDGEAAVQPHLPEGAPLVGWEGGWYIDRVGVVAAAAAAVDGKHPVLFLVWGGAPKGWISPTLLVMRNSLSPAMRNSEASCVRGHLLGCSLFLNMILIEEHACGGRFVSAIVLIEELAADLFSAIILIEELHAADLLLHFCLVR